MLRALQAMMLRNFQALQCRAFKQECCALLPVAGEPVESAAAQSVLAPSEIYSPVSAGSTPLQKGSLSVPGLHRDNLCFAGRCDDLSLSALPAAAASSRQVAQVEDLSTRCTSVPTGGEILCWRCCLSRPCSDARLQLHKP